MPRTRSSRAIKLRRDRRDHAAQRRCAPSTATSGTPGTSRRTPSKSATAATSASVADRRVRCATTRRARRCSTATTRRPRPLYITRNRQSGHVRSTSRRARASTYTYKQVPGRYEIKLNGASSASTTTTRTSPTSATASSYSYDANVLQLLRDGALSERAHHAHACFRLFAIVVIAAWLPAPRIGAKPASAGRRRPQHRRCGANGSGTAQPAPTQPRRPHPGPQGRRDPPQPRPAGARGGTAVPRQHAGGAVRVDGRGQDVRARLGADQARRQGGRQLPVHAASRCRRCTAAACSASTSAT